MFNRRTVVALLALVVSACGGGGSSEAKPPNQWAAAVCGQVASWQEGVGSLMTLRAEEEGDLASARAELVGYIDRIAGRTDQMIASINDEDPPEGANGARVADGLREGLERIRVDLADARTKVENLSVAAPAEFQQGVEEVVGDLAAVGAALEQELGSLGERFDAPAVDAAIANEPDCQQVAIRGDIPARAWADEVCGQIVAWQGELQTLVGQLQSQVQEVGRDPAIARERFVDFIAQVVASTDRLLQATEQAGIPDTPQGDQVAGALQEGLRQLRRSFEEGRANAENVAVDDPIAFADGMQRISDSITQAGERMEQVLADVDGTYDIAELDRAFAEAPACRQASG